jgi:signal transduction histidine kinase
VTVEYARRRSLWQILLLTAGFLVLVAISTASVILVNDARRDSRRVVHTVEVENQISVLLLEVRRAESAARGYLLTVNPKFLAEYESAMKLILPDADKLISLTTDNPVQVENGRRLRPLVEARIAELVKAVDFVRKNDIAGGVAMLRDSTSTTAQMLSVVTADMRTEEDRLFALRTDMADRTQQLSSLVTIAGSTLVVALAVISIFLVRRSTAARDKAEEDLRNSNSNLEAAVNERTADLQDANEEIQRFAYIVSHDLRSPLVNIMGFTSELEQLRSAIFTRVSQLSKGTGASDTPAQAQPVAVDEIPLDEPDRQLAQEYSEAIGFIKSSIGKMDRLISAILNLTREGRRQFHPVKIETRELIEGIVSTVAHQAYEANAQIRIEPLPDIVSDRLSLEQIFSNLIDNALKYLKPGVPGDITIRGSNKMGFAVFEIADNGRGIDPKDHQRIFDLFRRAGKQDKPGQGIGLAHVRALVRRMGGTMSVKSELDQGSKFTVTLPAFMPAQVKET